MLQKKEIESNKDLTQIEFVFYFNIKVQLNNQLNIHCSYVSDLYFPAESDLVTFVQIKSHYKTDYEIGTKLFTVETRSATLAEMYDMAAKTPVAAINEMDRIMGHRDRRSSDAFICTPIMGQTRRRMNKNIDIDIETRMVSLYYYFFVYYHHFFY